MNNGLRLNGGLWIDETAPGKLSFNYTIALQQTGLIHLERRQFQCPYCFKMHQECYQRYKADEERDRDRKEDQVQVMRWIRFKVSKV